MALYASKMMRVAAIAAATALALSACGKGDEKAAGQQAQGSQQQQNQPAPEVRVGYRASGNRCIDNRVAGPSGIVAYCRSSRPSRRYFAKQPVPRMAAMCKPVSLCTKSTAQLMKQT